MSVRVRFAPSPTGLMHLGGLRMALYNYIFARQNKGSFILRIEDTDQKRIVPGSAKNIEDSLEWANIIPDESPTKGGQYGPYIQSQRLQLYKDSAHHLVSIGKAYKCFCSPMRLELLRRQQAKSRVPIGYDGKCRNLQPREIDDKLIESKNSYVIRLALRPGSESYTDMIFGYISENYPEKHIKSDTVLLKADSFPTYHLANVVDDHNMKITHVLRGSEWISSTLNHVYLYESFGWKPPVFAHFPLINAKVGVKLSKRNDDSSVDFWRASGYEPLALLNFLTTMGGGIPKSKQDANEVWDLPRIIEEFDFSKVSSHPGSLDIDRLNAYSKNELDLTWSQDQDIVVKRLRDLFIVKDIDCNLDDETLKKIISTFIGRVSKLSELVNNDHAFIWGLPKLTWSKESYSQDLVSIIQTVIKIVEEVGIEDKALLFSKFKECAEINGMKYSILMKLIRQLITNYESGLPIHELFQYLGHEKTIHYLRNGLTYIEI